MRHRSRKQGIRDVVVTNSLDGQVRSRSFSDVCTRVSQTIVVGDDPGSLRGFSGGLLSAPLEPNLPPYDRAVDHA